MKSVAIFGSTGSVGTSALEVIEDNLDLFEVVTLVAGRTLDKLTEQINKFKPKHVYIKREEDAKLLKKLFSHLDIYHGNDGMEEISNLNDYDIAVSALVGIAGLKPTYNMIKHGKTIALANKEVLVAGGKLIIDTAKKYKSTILTVDSEHSAILQCLRGEEGNQIDKILLTASGGPFSDIEISNDIKVEEALNHPTWNMGKKITIDSATMMNKGLEVIEASWLFDVLPDQIEVVVHKESLIHSMVQFKDGTIIASIGPRSMQIPIAYALHYPKRLENKLNKLNLFEIKSLNFEKPNFSKFKCLKLAFDSIKLGHSYQVVLNAANEICVEAFLNKQIGFTDIADIIEEMLSRHKKQGLNTIDDILNLDTKIKEDTIKHIGG